MDWIYYVSLAAFLWSITNVMDKFLVGKRVSHPITLSIFVKVASLIPMILVLPFIGFSFPEMQSIGLIFLAGVFIAAGVIFYYKAIQTEEISKTVPLFQFIPVFVLFLSFFFISEVLGFFDYVGFVVLVLGGLIISAKNPSKLLRVEKAFWFAVVSSLCTAISYVIMKHVFSSVEYWSAFILLWVFQSFAMLFLLGSPKIRKEARTYARTIELKDVVLIISVALISFLAFTLNFFAINLGPVTLVEAAANMQLAFMFILAMFLTRFFPRTLEERFDKKAMQQKLIGMALIILGVLMTQLL